MFRLFHKVLLLAEGQMVYYGSPEHVVQYFSSIGKHCSPHYNPADFICKVSFPLHKEFNHLLLFIIYEKIHCCFFFVIAYLCFCIFAVDLVANPSEIDYLNKQFEKSVSVMIGVSIVFRWKRNCDFRRAYYNSTYYYFRKKHYMISLGINSTLTKTKNTIL